MTESELQALRERMHKGELLITEVQGRVRGLEASELVLWQEVRRLERDILGELRDLRERSEAQQLALSLTDSRWKFSAWVVGAIATLIIVIGSAVHTIKTLVQSASQ